MMRRRMKMAIMVVIMLLAVAAGFWRVRMQEWRLVGQFPMTSNWIRHVGLDGVWYDDPKNVYDTGPLLFRDWQGTVRWQVTIPDCCGTTSYSPDGRVLATVSQEEQGRFITTWRDGQRIGHVTLPSSFGDETEWFGLHVYDNGRVWVLNTLGSTLKLSVVEGNRVISHGSYTSVLPRPLTAKEQRLLPSGDSPQWSCGWTLAADASTAAFRCEDRPPSLSQVMWSLQRAPSQIETIALAVQGTRVVATHTSFDNVGILYAPRVTSSSAIPLAPGTDPIMTALGSIWAVPNSDQNSPTITPSGHFALVREDQRHPSQHIQQLCSYLERIPGTKNFIARIKQPTVTFSLYQQPGRRIARMVMPVGQYGKMNFYGELYDGVHDYLSPDGRHMLLIAERLDEKDGSYNCRMFMYTR